MKYLKYYPGFHCDRCYRNGQAKNFNQLFLQQSNMYEPGQYFTFFSKKWFHVGERSSMLERR